MPAVDPINLAVPGLPEALAGLRILHLTDLHARGTRKGGAKPQRVVDELIRALPNKKYDLVAFTGDYAHHSRDGEAAAEVVARLVSVLRPRIGAFGVFGNHDTADAVRRVSAIPGVRWLMNEAAFIRVKNHPVWVIGASEPEDLLSAADHAVGPGFRLTILHDPSHIYTAAALKLPLVLAGHTHGGQWRLGKRAFHTSTDLPDACAAGVIQLGPTTMAVSRGLGESVARVRVSCARQAPLYALRSAGPLPANTEVGVSPRVVQSW